MKDRLLSAIAAMVVSGLAAVPVLAFGAKTLPTTAEKLSGNQILALYDGSTFKFKDYRSEIPNTGTVIFDLKKNIRSGKLDGYGQILGSVKINGDTLCGQGGGNEICTSVYVSGTDIYEVSPEGVVVVILEKQ